MFSCLSPLRTAVKVPAVAKTLAPWRSFGLLTDAQNQDPTTPQFFVGLKNGFLPREEPMVKLPREFKDLEDLLTEMPLTKADGTHGLLWEGKFGDAVKARLPQYDVSKIENTALLTALFRDYTFAASSYLLEPCDLFNRQNSTTGGTTKYGLGREVLPASIAVPLNEISKKIGAKPFMEYAMSYALMNYTKLDTKGSLEPQNLRLIRTFHGGESEKGFVAVHVAMVQHTGRLVAHTQATIDGAAQKDRVAFNRGLSGLEEVLGAINQVMDTMWMHSKPQDYLTFRTFIMGTKDQPMFPKGVVYEGVSSEPTFFRGESGANDSIVPTCDNLLELTGTMPSNPLTMILKDFRTYRPVHHSQWLEHVDENARQVHVKDFAMGDATSAVLYLANVDRVREFRARHWNFTKEYIIRYTTHPVATGGSPIITWLPNQLNSVLKAMEVASKAVRGHLEHGAKLDAATTALFGDLETRGAAQRRILLSEVRKLAEKYPDQAPDIELLA